MALAVLPSGYQLLNWPSSWSSYYSFRDRWGLTDAAAIRALALGWYVQRQMGVRLWIISGRRSAAEQARLYARAAAGDSTRPAAPPGESLHESGRAFDVGGDYALTRSQWAAIGRIASQLGLRWGGNFVGYDPNHFDLG